MTGLILAAGKGTRLFQHGSAGGCKPLVEVHGKKLLSYALDNLLCLGINRAVVVVGEHADAIKRLYGNTYKGIRLVYAFQEKQNGIVSAILSAEPYITDEIALQLSDEIFVGLKPLPEAWNRGADFAVGYVTEADKNKIKGNYSIDTDADGTVLRCTEKPTEVFNPYKGTGFCLFKKEMLDILRAFYESETNEPNDLCDFINLLIRQGRRGRIFEVADAEININTEHDLQQARTMIG